MCSKESSTAKMGFHSLKLGRVSKRSESSLLSYLSLASALAALSSGYLVAFSRYSQDMK